MNAAFTTTQTMMTSRMLSFQQRRTFSAPVQPMFQFLFAKPQVAAVRNHNPLVPERYNYTVKKAWLNDPSTYPLMAVLVFTTSIIVGFGYNALANYQDVKINPAHKHQTIRDWGEIHQTKVAEVIGKRPIGMNARRFTTIPNEGLGIDHGQWAKEREKRSPEEYEYDKSTSKRLQSGIRTTAQRRTDTKVKVRLPRVIDSIRSISIAFVRRQPTGTRLKPR